MSEGPRVWAPFRALVWKQWRQLRLLRWIGAGVSLGLPLWIVVLMTLGSNVDHGYTFTEVWVQLVPIFLAGLWGVLTLFVVTESFVGDRVTGSELFLLACPVSRRQVWNARLLTSLASILTIVTCGFGIWLAWALLSSEAGVVGIDAGKAGWLAGSGAVVIAIAFSSGLAATALVASPLPAVLAGFVFAAVPLGLAILLGATFPLARTFELPVGALLPPILFPVFVVASYRGLCVGEPAGGGRYARIGKLLGGTLAVMAVVFVLLAHLSVRGGSPEGRPLPSPAAALALVYDDWPVRRAWLVDTSANSEVHDFGVSVWEASWSADGRYLAVITHGGPLGMLRPSGRVEIFDTSRREVIGVLKGEDWDLPQPLSLTWTATRLWVVGLDGRGERRLVSARVGEWSLARVPLDSVLRETDGAWGIAGTGANGRLYFAATALERAGARRWMLRFHSVDTERGEVAVEPHAEFTQDEVPVLRGLIVKEAFERRLAPSGRYWVLSEPGAAAPLETIDLDTGDRLAHEATKLGRIAWLAGDTLVWIDREEDRSRVRAWSPETGARDLLELEADRSVQLSPAPDRRRLLVTEMQQGGGIDQRTNHLYDVASGGWMEIDTLYGLPMIEAWGGPDVLVAWTEEGLTYHPLGERR